MSRLAARLLPDGRRLFLQDGPIELIVEAWGRAAAVRAARGAACDRAASILDELCMELSLLRRAARPDDAPLCGVVARRMQLAVTPYAADMFITPMAAVAGAVAEEVLAAMLQAPLDRAYVNNGGDIALHMQPGEALTVGLVDRPDQPSLFGRAVLRAEDRVRGIATSGWRGRSHSLGIADAVTVLANTAAEADAAATVIANSVDLPGHPAVRRVRCKEIDPDSDLGDLPVTRDVGALTEEEVSLALRRGTTCAERLVERGLIETAALHLRGLQSLLAATAYAPEADCICRPGVSDTALPMVLVQFGER